MLRVHAPEGSDLGSEPLLAQRCFFLVFENEKGCGRDHGKQGHSGEQQQGDGGPVGVHGVQAELRHHLSKLPSDVVIGRPVTVAILLILSGALAPQVFASDLNALQTSAMACLQVGRLSSCQTALIQAEVLQRRASARNAFPCQTLLLGLQADLIMQQLGDGRGEKAVLDVATTGRGCAGL